MGLSCFKVIAMGMVNRMAALPGKGRNKQQAVQQKPNAVLNGSARMESVMAARMGQHPASCCQCSGNHGIGNPYGCITPLQRDKISNPVGSQGSQQGK
jgi:hypothetical protein